MKFLKSKFFIICLLVAILLAATASALSMSGQTDILRGALGTIAKPFLWCGNIFSNAVNGFTDVFTEHDRLVAENQELRDQLEAMKNSSAEAEIYKAENMWLKEFLDLKSNRPEFTFTDARIISRESGNYSTVFMLNKGSIHGIKKNMAVITEDGVLGHVSEVGLDFCKVVSILESSSAVGVYAERSGASGVAKGDLNLKEEGKCVLTYSADADIKIGDTVCTSGGSGSIYPDGLFLGEIVSIKADEVTRTLVAEVKAAVDLTDGKLPQNVVIITGYGQK